MAGSATLLVVGFGYCGRAIASLAVKMGYSVQATIRGASRMDERPGLELVSFDDPEPYRSASHIVVTVPPRGPQDPVLQRHGQVLRTSAARWIGYISTTGVYGDHQGGWVDELTPPSPGLDRSAWRLEAENAWGALSSGRAIDLFRTGGIYGPGRSSFDDIRAGTARCVLKPGHAFSRIHRDDIARAVVSAMGQGRQVGPRILHLVDDEPAEPAEVAREAARLLGVEPPPAVPFEVAHAAMSEMGRSFWAENRRVSNTRTKAALGLEWAYPTFREGLRGILAQEGPQRAPQEPEVRR